MKKSKSATKAAKAKTTSRSRSFRQQATLGAHFEGEVQTQWLTADEPNRQMRLLAPFVFVDQKGERWVANIGDVIDGASIPRILWTVAGSPFVGDYRRASVLHDVACDQKTRPSKDVHRMFYEAMRADNVPEEQALEFYTAVRLFGPHWEVTPAGTVKSFSARARVRPGVTFKDIEAALDSILTD